MKIKIQDNKKIIKNYKRHRTYFIISLFFLALIAGAILTATKYSALILFFGAIPLAINMLYNQQEMNYNQILMEIRRKK